MANYISSFKGSKVDELLTKVQNGYNASEISVDNSVKTALADNVQDSLENLVSAFGGSLNANNGEPITIWIGTQVEYDAIATPVSDCLYIITDDRTLQDIEDGMPVIELNGSSNAQNQYSFYAPVSQGASGQFLKSAGANNSPIFGDIAATDVKKDGGNIVDYIDTKLTTFHASIDNSSFQYVKGSADFTYADAIASENCQVEIQIANENMYLQKLEHKNIDPPDPIAGRYVSFCGMIRVAGEMAEIFLFVYDNNNLPTDAGSVERLADWGDYTYCQSSYQPVVMKNFLKQDIAADRNVTNDVASIKAVGDYTDSQCGVVINYMQTTFAQNMMALIEDQYGPHVVFTGNVNADNTNPSGCTKQSFNQSISEYKRLKFYIHTNTSDFGNRSTPSLVIEIPLDGQYNTDYEMYVAGAAASNPSDRNVQYHALVGVASDLSGFYFISSHSIYGTALGGRNDNGRTLYKIEGYKN